MLLNPTSNFLMTLLLALVLLILSPKSMASPEEYQWSSMQVGNCSLALVWKRCVSFQETQVSKLKLPMEESKLFASLNSEKSLQTKSVEFGLTQPDNLLPTQQVTYQKILVGESSLSGLQLKVLQTLSPLPMDPAIHIMFKQQF